uniref:RNA-directed RNA polymerase n=2 Tax=unclassified Totiviridae TaxID=39756 RepID=A0A141NWH3_9VIRU|nr:RNA-dependent RNA polymerase [Delisea pulchra totivirus IndA]
MCRIRGEVIPALFLTGKHHTYVYAPLSVLTNWTPKLAQVAGVHVLSQRSYIVLDSDKSEVNFDQHWKVDQSVEAGMVNPFTLRTVVRTATWERDEEKIPSTVFPFKWERSKVTAEHHTLLRPEEVVNKVRGRVRMRLVARMLEALIGTAHSEAMVSSLLLWACTARAWLVDKVIRSDLLNFQQSTEDWAESAKEACQAMKAHQHFQDSDLVDVFELNVLVNRGIGSVDWETERKHRLRPDLVNITAEQVYKAATQIFRGRDVGRYRYRSESWSAFWERRWAQTPRGSVHSQYLDDDKYVDKTSRVTRNKQLTVTRMPQLGASYFLNREPEIVAWPSTKYEWGKQRAIYGTDLTSYLLTDFSMSNVEKSLPRDFPVGELANEKYVAERIDLAATDGIAFCFDYEDFNSQHSLTAQKAVIDAFADLYWSEASPEQRQSLEWVAMAHLRQTVKDSERGDYTIRGTLLSGNRLTTLINTVLNKVYLDKAGLGDHAITAVHNGDDVLAYTHTVHDAVLLLKKAEALGIRAQPAKCVIGGIHEFLRVDRRAGGGVGSQYLTRACATATHARTESNEPVALRAVLEANHTRLTELGSRTDEKEYAERLLKRANGRVADLFNTDGAVTSIIESTHRVHGGMSEDPDLLPCYEITELPVAADTMEIEAARKLPGVRAFARYLLRTLGLDKHLMLTTVEKIAILTAKAKLLVRRALDVKRLADVDKAGAQQYLHKVCQDEAREKVQVGKGRLAGLPLGLVLATRGHSMASVRISQSDNPLKTMSIIF